MNCAPSATRCWTARTTGSGSMPQKVLLSPTLVSRNLTPSAQVKWAPCPSSIQIGGMREVADHPAHRHAVGHVGAALLAQFHAARVLARVARELALPESATSAASMPARSSIRRMLSAEDARRAAGACAPRALFGGALRRDEGGMSPRGRSPFRSLVPAPFAAPSRRLRPPNHTYSRPVGASWTARRSGRARRRSGAARRRRSGRVASGCCAPGARPRPARGPRARAARSWRTSRGGPS